MSKEKVYIVKTDWDIVGDGEGSDVIGAFSSLDKAKVRFEGEIARIKQEYPTELDGAEIWDDDTSTYWSATNDDFVYNVDIVEMTLDE